MKPTTTLSSPQSSHPISHHVINSTSHRFFKSFSTLRYHIYLMQTLVDSCVCLQSHVSFPPTIFPAVAERTLQRPRSILSLLDLYIPLLTPSIRSKFLVLAEKVQCHSACFQIRFTPALPPQHVLEIPRCSQFSPIQLVFQAQVIPHRHCFTWPKCSPLPFHLEGEFLTLLTLQPKCHLLQKFCPAKANHSLCYATSISRINL